MVGPPVVVLLVWSLFLIAELLSTLSTLALNVSFGNLSIGHFVKLSLLIIEFQLLVFHDSSFDGIGYLIFRETYRDVGSVFAIDGANDAVANDGRA